MLWCCDPEVKGVGGRQVFSTPAMFAAVIVARAVWWASGKL